MRIAIAINTSWNISHFRSGIIKSLLQSNHEVVAIAPTDKYVSDIETLGARFVPVSLESHGLNILKDIWLLISYIRIFRREQIDCVLTYTVKPNIYGSLAARVLSIPVMNNISGLGAVFIKKSWLTFFVKRLYRHSLKKSQCVFFQNPDDCKLFEAENLVRPEISATLPGSGIDLNRYSISNGEVTRNGKELIFLLVCRLLWDKGLGEYFRAAEILKKQYHGLSFHLLGEFDSGNPNGLSLSEFEQLINSNTVDYLGTTSDVRPHMKAADCIVLPSYREGLPRVLLEASALEKPMIASDVAGCREVVVDGVTGFLCQARSHQSLVKSLEKFVRLSIAERKSFGSAARHRVETYFDEKIVIDQYMRRLNNLKIK